MKRTSNSFYLIRHAHVEFTLDENRSLSNKGNEQAEKVADLLTPFPIDEVYSSPYQRAYQTIKPLAERLNLTIQIEPDVRERKLSDAPVKDFTVAVHATWQDFTFAHSGGESNIAAQKRGLGVIHRLLNRNSGRHIVISTHGNLLTLILNGSDSSIGFDFWKSLTMPDTFRLTIRENKAVEILRVWQDSDL